MADQVKESATVSETVTALINERLSRAADKLCAELGTGRNGYRNKRVDTIHGTLTVRVPKFRRETFPVKLANEIIHGLVGDALENLVTTCYVKGVSTRSMEDVTDNLAVEKMSRSKVSRITGPKLDTIATKLNESRFVNGPYRFVQLDAMVVKANDGGRVVFVHILTGIGVNRDGRLESLGFEVTSAENGSGWKNFLRKLVQRGLNGVQFVTADAHAGLAQAVALNFPGAAQQRDTKHYMDNLLDYTPKLGHDSVRACVNSIYEQSTKRAVDRKFRSVVKAIGLTYPEASKHLESAREEITAFRTFPREAWARIRTSNRIENLNGVIRSRCARTKSFKNRKSITRLVAAILADQSAQWASGARWIGLDVLSACDRPTTAPTPGGDVESWRSGIAAPAEVLVA